MYSVLPCVAGCLSHPPRATEPHSTTTLVLWRGSQQWCSVPPSIQSGSGTFTNHLHNLSRVAFGLPVASLHRQNSGGPSASRRSRDGFFLLLAARPPQADHRVSARRVWKVPKSAYAHHRPESLGCHHTTLDTLLVDMLAGAHQAYPLHCCCQIPPGPWPALTAWCTMAVAGVAPGRRLGHPRGRVPASLVFDAHTVAHPSRGFLPRQRICRSRLKPSRRSPSIRGVAHRSQAANNASARAAPAPYLPYPRASRPQSLGKAPGCVVVYPLSIAWATPLSCPQVIQSLLLCPLNVASIHYRTELARLSLILFVWFTANTGSREW